MKDLIILSMYGHAQEMVEVAERMNMDKKQWNILGFISPNDTYEPEERNGYPVLGAVNDVDKFPNAWFALESEWSRLKNLPLDRCATLIDPTCFVSRTARIGRGCVLHPHCFVGYKAQIRDFVFILSGVTINHENVLEDRVLVTSKVTLAGGVQIGRGTYLGQSCTVRQNVKIGSQCVVGMGAVVVRDVPDKSIVVGNPAKVTDWSTDVYRPGTGMGMNEFKRLHDIED
jgi:sugar O-acyltransferase (sialic acid O-acetyltransferase NeuD family)